MNLKLTRTHVELGVLKTREDFLVLIKQYAPYIEKKIDSLGIGPFDDQDIRYEIYKRYLVAVEKGTIIKDPRAYIFSITRNVCADFCKQRKKNKGVILSLDDNTNDCREALSINTGILERQEQKSQEKIQSIMDLIPHLKPRTQQLLKKRFLEEKEYSKLALEYNMSEAAIRKEISRGLQKIRNLLGL